MQELSFSQFVDVEISEANPMSLGSSATPTIAEIREAMGLPAEEPEQTKILLDGPKTKRLIVLNHCRSRDVTTRRVVVDDGSYDVPKEQPDLSIMTASQSYALYDLSASGDVISEKLNCRFRE